MTARRHGVHTTVERITHDYALTEEPETRRLIRIAQDIGLKSNSKKVSWDDLARVGKAFPVLCRLKNGNWVVIAALSPAKEGEEPVALVLDPMSEGADMIRVDRETLEKAWGGEIVFLKKSFQMTDEEQPFGFRWFIPEALRHKSLFAEVGLAALLMHVLALASPVFFQITLDKVIGNQAIDTLYVLAGGVFVAFTFNAIIEYLRGLLLLHATGKMDVRVATRTFGKLMSLPIDFFRGTSAGTLTKHMQQTGTVREFLTGRMFLTLLDSTAMVIYLPILFFYSATLTWIVLGFTAVIGAITLFIKGPYRKRLQALYKAEGKRQSLLVETIGGMETVKALATEPIKAREWADTSARAVTMQLSVGKISHLVKGLTKYLGQVMTAAIIFFGAQMVFTGDVSVGALIAFNMLAMRVSGPLIQLVGLVNEFEQASLSVKMLGEIMNRKPEQSSTGGLTPKIKGAIEFDGVTFRYGADGPPALDNVSLSIDAGQVIGVVGRSGSGKSSLLRVLQGLYKPGSGIIRIDGVDMREIDLAHLRMNTGVVLQESFLFKGTVRENIAITRPDSAFADIVSAAKIAGADEFIQRLPQGYDTELDEGAANLSGGQKQRLAIARSLLRQPRILIMDEATSALDPESEAIVQANLQHIAEGRTVIIVSHRLSTLVDVDKIMVIDEGKIIDEGKHADLLKSCSIYSHLWNTQNPDFKQAAE
ncbi:MAG: peptidase domain-containing ABC transporter [Rhodospirillales bacterium]|nr:peptidase domain-containing ABC transporter [Rhodospirillales bacterium]